MSVPTPIGLGISWFLLWLFAQAAYHKISAPAYYEQLVTRYVPGLPAGRVWVALIALLETAIALSLLLSQSRKAGLMVCAALLLLYGALMAIEVLRGRSGMQCGCAGPDSQLGLSWGLVARNIVCVMLAGIAITAHYGVGIGWLGMALAGFVALFTALVYLTSEQIISNAQWMAGEA